MGKDMTIEDVTTEADEIEKAFTTLNNTLDIASKCVRVWAPYTEGRADSYLKDLQLAVIILHNAAVIVKKANAATESLTSVKRCNRPCEKHGKSCALPRKHRGGSVLPTPCVCLDCVQDES